MAINKNHEFEELNGVKCAIVERNASQQRVDFLKPLLEFNKYTVIIAASPPAKATAPAATAANPDTSGEPTPPPHATYTIGVTDVTFNPTNALFGRLLKTPSGQVVTVAYWQQRDTVSRDDIPYFARK
ncbi:hypothetical protein [Longitalea luteola]|uniref:hypothetical protein n=1 Tax=Longitalea luteola TaxID=2812563 RepID=UPI001A96CE70|nr:hypothetical protein [Longitalea luteola]